MPSVQLTFDLAYVASKDPRIQALFAGTLGLPGASLDPATRQAQALNLALTTSLVIDGLIDAAGADPYYTMLWRAEDEYTTYPSILQPGVQVPPGLSFPGLPPYDPALYAIKVSTNLADYPPFTVPTPTPTPAQQTLFGVIIAPGYIFASQLAINLASSGALKPGTLEVNPADGLTYALVVSANPMGNSYFWKAN